MCDAVGSVRARSKRPFPVPFSARRPPRRGREHDSSGRPAQWKLKEDFVLPSPCTVCLHPDRAEVDRRLASGHVKLAPLSRSLGVGRKALERHRDRHVPSPLANVHAHRDAVCASPLLEELERLYHLSVAALASAEGAALSYIEPHRLGPPASHAAIAAFVNEARRHLGDLAELFVDAAEAGHLVAPLEPCTRDTNPSSTRTYCRTRFGARHDHVDIRCPSRKWPALSAKAPSARG